MYLKYYFNDLEKVKEVFSLFGILVTFKNSNDTFLGKQLVCFQVNNINILLHKMPLNVFSHVQLKIKTNLYNTHLFTH